MIKTDKLGPPIAMTGYELSYESGVGKFTLKVGDALASAGHNVHYVASKASPDIAATRNVHLIPGGIDPNQAPLSYVDSHKRHSSQVDKVLDEIDAGILFRSEFSPVKNDIFPTHIVYPAWMMVYEDNKEHFAPSFRRNMEITSSRDHHFDSERTQVEGAQVIVALSNQCAEDVKQHYGVNESRIVRTYNGADSSEFHPISEAERDELRNKFGIKESDIALTFNGFNFNRKGLSPLLKAMQKIIQSNKNVRLFVIGGTPGEFFTDMVSAMDLDANVNFLHALKTEEVGQLLNASDIFTLPSFYDPCPLVVSEAMACGVPMVISKQVGQSDFLEQGVHCETIDHPSEVEKLADAILSLSESKANRYNMRTQLLKLSTDHQWDATTKPIVDRIGTIFE